MHNNCARCLIKAGHYFLGIIFVLPIVLTSACNSPSYNTRKKLIHNCGSTTILVSFPNSQSNSLMPEAVSSLPFTARGRFHSIINNSDNNCFNYISNLLESADQAGKLLFLILPESSSFSGIRDHLIVKINSEGIPVSIQPDLSSSFLADSLWEDPILRQSSIKELIDFFKPDIIFQYIPESSPETEIAVTEYWNQIASENDFSIALFSYHTQITESFNSPRSGWGIFTGKGFQNTVLNGLDFQIFINTVRLISNLNWTGAATNSNYMAIQALENVEIK